MKYKLSEYQDILDEFTYDHLTEYIEANNAIKRKILHRVIKSFTVENGLLELTFITDRKIKFELKNKPAWLLAQENQLRLGTYTVDYINFLRNRTEEQWKEYEALRR